jgi:L-asparagine oxygenase
MEQHFTSPQEADRVESVLARFVGRPVGTEALLGEIELAARSSLPEKVLSLLASMATAEGPPSAWIRGLVNENDLPPTPTRADAASNGRLCFLSEVVLLGIATVVGEPLSYRAEKNGALVQNVFPVETESNSPSNESSSFTLDLHTELVFSRRNPERPLDAESPDFILLWCLRGDPDQAAATIVATIDDLCAELRPSDLEILAEARFELRAPYSFTRDAPDDRPWVGPVPILSGEITNRLAALDLACGTRGIDDEAKTALLELRRAAQAPGMTQRLHLESGDLLVLNNRRCVHGRTSFPARFDGRDRWVLRGYVRRSLAGMQSVDTAFPRIF